MLLLQIIGPKEKEIHSSVRSLTLTFNFFLFIHSVQYHVSCAKLYFWQFAISVAFVFGTKINNRINVQVFVFFRPSTENEFSRAIFYTIHRLCGISTFSTYSYIHSKFVRAGTNTLKPKRPSIHLLPTRVSHHTNLYQLIVTFLPSHPPPTLNTRHKEYTIFFLLAQTFKYRIKLRKLYFFYMAHQLYCQVCYVQVMVAKKTYCLIQNKRAIILKEKKSS